MFFSCRHPFRVVSSPSSHPLGKCFTSSFPGLVLVDDFVADVEKRFPRDAKLVVGCQGGVRSKRASKMLVDSVRALN